MTAFLISIIVADRVRDIGVMRAVGCLTDMVFSYLLAELSIIIFTGCGIGAILGVVAGSASIWLLESLGFNAEVGMINVWAIILVLIIFAVISYAVGIYYVVRAIRIKPAEALSQIRQPRASYGLMKFIPSWFGFSLTVALRSLARRRAQTIHVIICLSAVLSLTTISVVGGVLAKETSQKYVERAIGKNVILIAKAEVAERYANLLSIKPSQSKPINYSDQRYMIPEDLISNLESIGGVLKVDPRLIPVSYTHLTLPTKA